MSLMQSHRSWLGTGPRRRLRNTVVIVARDATFPGSSLTRGAAPAPPSLFRRSQRHSGRNLLSNKLHEADSIEGAVGPNV